MKLQILAFAALLALASCSKSDDSSKSYPDHGCVTGISKTTGLREFIFCVHREVNIAGTNQAAADLILAKYNLPHVNVSVKNQYTDIQFAANEACDCE